MIKILNCFNVVPDLDKMSEGHWSSGLDSGFFDFRHTGYIIDGYSESALELTLKLRDSMNKASQAEGGDSEKAEKPELIAFTINDERADSHLRTLLALGFDEAVRADAAPEAGSSEQAASMISEIIDAKDRPDLVIMGSTAADGASTVTPVTAAVMSGYPFITNVTDMKFTDDGRCRVTSERDGLAITETRSFPLLVTVGNMQGGYLRVPTLMDRKNSMEKEISVMPKEMFREAIPGFSVESYEVVDRKIDGIKIESEDPKEIARAVLEEHLKGKVI